VQDAEKDELIQKMAVLWGHVQAGTQAEPETTEQCRLMYPVSTNSSRVANQAIEKWVEQLNQVKGELKKLEEVEESIKTHLQKYMGDADTLGTVDGRVLATWKSSKPSMKFNTDLFKTSMPDVYKQFQVEVPGSRRFLTK
jgi:hypothetical protein